MRHELVNAVARLLSIEGPVSLRAESTVLPVAIVDDMRDGPHEPFERWYASQAFAAIAGAYKWSTIRNLGPKGSLVVVDSVLIRQGIAGSIYGGVMLSADDQSTISSYALRRSSIGESTSNPSIRDVALYSGQNASAIGSNLIGPYLNADTVRELKGPWVLRDGYSLVLRGDTVNTVHDVAYYGRYYQPS